LTEALQPSFWRERLAPYAEPRLGRSVVDLATSVARIPNYNLQRAHDENPIFHDVPTLTWWDGVRSLRLKLYDEQRSRLVGFSAAR